MACAIGVVLYSRTDGICNQLDTRSALAEKRTSLPDLYEASIAELQVRLTQLFFVSIQRTDVTGFFHRQGLMQATSRVLI